MSSRHPAAREPQVNQTAPSLLTLPDAVLEAIFNRVSTKPAVLGHRGLTLAAVSLRLNKFYREDYVTCIAPSGPRWRSPDRAPDELARALRRLPRARSLELAACTGITQDMRSCFADTKRTRDIRAIHLRHLPVNDIAFCTIIDAMPRLAAVDLSGTKVDDYSLYRLMQGQFETLRELALHKVHFSDNAGKMIGTLKNLRVLDLSCCSALTDLTFQELSGLESMEVLNLQDTQISPNDLTKALDCMQKLTSLNVCSCRQLTSRVIPHFPRFLRGLFISQTAIFSGVFYLPGYPKETFSHLRCLESLSAEYMEDLYEMSVLSSLAVNLRELHIPYNGISDLSTALLESMINLEILDIAGCEAVGDVSANRIATLPKLNALDMSATRITNEGIRILTRSSCPLQSVELYNCEFVDNHDGVVDNLRHVLLSRGGSGVWWDYGERSDESEHEADDDYLDDGDDEEGEQNRYSQENEAGT
jgi:hypothetical protein